MLFINISSLLLAFSCVLIFVLIYFYIRQNKKFKVLQSEKHKLIDANQMKDRVFSSIGHDLKAPLSSIVAILYLMENDLISLTEKKTLLDQLIKAHWNAIDILDKLLYWGNLNQKEITTDQSIINLNLFLNSYIVLFKDNLSDKSIQVINALPSNLNIYIDISHFEFIIKNILQNAIKFSNKGGLIKIELSKSGYQNGYVVLKISDEGIGISTKIMDEIFLGAISGSYGTANEKGTGLGLLLSKAFIEANGGSIRLETNLNVGTTVFLTFKTYK